MNWCPRLGTVLANEEVTADGKSERGNFPVYKRPLKQWMMRITAYADRLAADLEGLDWPEPIKLLQRNWIGRSEGAYVDFAAGEGSIRVYTTRPDTLHGATYMVLSPEHSLVDALTTDAAKPTAFRQAIFPGAAESSAPRANVAAYRAFVKSKTDRQRQEAKDKTGVFTGAYAVNPVNGKRIPVFIADYVLMGYGTGAIMACPRTMSATTTSRRRRARDHRGRVRPGGHQGRGVLRGRGRRGELAGDRRALDARGQARDHRAAGA